jgi:hypothetical protein
MSDAALSDARLTTALPPLPHVAAAGGTGPMPARADDPRFSTPPSFQADRLVGRVIDRAVDRPVAREAVRVAARHAVGEAGTLGGRESATALTWVGTSDAGATVDPSPALVGHLGHLRATVTRYVGERRDAGAPVERVLPEVKDLVREAATRELWFETAEALVRQVVRWTITAYYDHPSPSDGPRAA